MGGKINIPQDVSFSTSDRRSPPPSPTASQPSLIEDLPLKLENTSAQDCSDNLGESSLESKLSSLEISDSPPSQMFASIAAIFQRATAQEEVDVGVGDWRALLERAEASSRRGNKDIDALRLVRTILDYLWSSGSEEDLVSASKILADGSRECESGFE